MRAQDRKKLDTIRRAIRVTEKRLEKALDESAEYGEWRRKKRRSESILIGLFLLVWIAVVVGFVILVNRKAVSEALQKERDARIEWTGKPMQVEPLNWSMGYDDYSYISLRIGKEFEQFFGTSKGFTVYRDGETLIVVEPRGAKSEF